MPNEEYTAKFKVDISDLKKGISDAQKEMQLANAQFKASSAGMDNWAKSSDGLTAKLKQLDSNLQSQKQILQSYQDQLKRQEQAYTENGNRADQLKAKLQELAQSGVAKTDAQYQKYEKALRSVIKEQENNGRACDELKLKILNQQAAVTKTEASIEKYTAAQKKLESESKSLTQTVEQQRQKLDQLKAAYADAVASEGKHSASARALAKEITSLSQNLDKNEKELNEARNAADQLDGSFQKTEGSTSKFASTLAGGLKAGLAAAATGLLAVGAAVVKLGTEAIKSYADYEQLVGGVEKLFGDAAPMVQKNASNAFKTAGLSANQYMETVTSFSASLINSLGDNTADAADYADRAIRDMSDNANTFGTDIENLQNVYKNFAKGQFNTLDNLYLGYGGSKEEMQRLIKDASKLKDIQKELGVSVDAKSMDFDNIINAISVIQKNLGIMGTTENEALKTISGSFNMLKAAWSNLLTGIADDSQNFDQLISNLSESLLAFVGNLLPRIEVALGGVSNLITGLADKILPPLLDMIPGLVDSLIPAVQSVFNTLLQALISMSPQLTQAVFTLLDGAVMAILEALPQMVQAGMQITTELAKGLAESAPELMRATVECFFAILDTLLAPENLDSMIDAAIELILALANGLIEALPMLIERIPEIIVAILDAIVRNLPKIIEAGVLLIEALIEGVVKTVGALAIAIADLIEGVKTWFTSVDWSSLGKNIIDGIVSGVQRWASNLWESVKSLASEAVERMKSALGIASPSKVFANEIGRMIPAGIAQGIEKNLPELSKAVKDMIDDVKAPAIAFTGADAVKAGRGWINSLVADTAQQRAAIAGSSIVNEGNRTQTFTQNIYAPKAPSRIELYRQTRNLLNYARLAGGV